MTQQHQGPAPSARGARTSSIGGGCGVGGGAFVAKCTFCACCSSRSGDACRDTRRLRRSCPPGGDTWLIRPTTPVLGMQARLGAAAAAGAHGPEAAPLGRRPPVEGISLLLLLRRGGAWAWGGAWAMGTPTSWVVAAAVAVALVTVHGTTRGIALEGGAGDAPVGGPPAGHAGSSWCPCCASRSLDAASRPLVLMAAVLGVPSDAAGDGDAPRLLLPAPACFLLACAPCLALLLSRSLVGDQGSLVCLWVPLSNRPFRKARAWLRPDTSELQNKKIRRRGKSRGSGQGAVCKGEWSGVSGAAREGIMQRMLGRATHEGRAVRRVVPELQQGQRAGQCRGASGAAGARWWWG